MVSFKGLTIEKNSIFYKPFRKAVQRLFEAGITNKFPGKEQYQQHERYLMEHIHETDSHFGVVLTCKLLDACFYAWLGFVLLAILAFLGELLVFKITTRRETTIQ